MVSYLIRYEGSSKDRLVLGLSGEQPPAQGCYICDAVFGANGVEMFRSSHWKEIQKLFEWYNLKVQVKKVPEEGGGMRMDIAACMHHRVNLDFLVQQVATHSRIDPSSIVRSLVIEPR